MTDSGHTAHTSTAEGDERDRENPQPESPPSTTDPDGTPVENPSG